MRRTMMQMLVWLVLQKVASEDAVGSSQEVKNAVAPVFRAIRDVAGVGKFERVEAFGIGAASICVSVLWEDVLERDD